MEDGDTEKYHTSSVIQDFVFWKGGCIRCISFRYIINSLNLCVLLHFPVNIFQSCREGSSLVEPVLRRG